MKAYLERKQKKAQIANLSILNKSAQQISQMKITKRPPLPQNQQQQCQNHNPQNQHPQPHRQPQNQQKHQRQQNHNPQKQHQPQPQPQPQLQQNQQQRQQQHPHQQKQNGQNQYLQKQQHQHQNKQPQIQQQQQKQNQQLVKGKKHMKRKPSAHALNQKSKPLPVQQIPKRPHVSSLPKKVPQKPLPQQQNRISHPPYRNISKIQLIPTKPYSKPKPLPPLRSESVGELSKNEIEAKKNAKKNILISKNPIPSTSNTIDLTKQSNISSNTNLKYTYPENPQKLETLKIHMKKSVSFDLTYHQQNKYLFLFSYSFLFVL